MSLKLTNQNEDYIYGRWNGFVCVWRGEREGGRKINDVTIINIGNEIIMHSSISIYIPDRFSKGIIVRCRDEGHINGMPRQLACGEDGHNQFMVSHLPIGTLHFAFVIDKHCSVFKW